MTEQAPKKRGRPTRAEVEARARAVMNVVSRYEAAGTGRRMAGWNPPSSGPNRAITGLQKIRDRSRDARRNEWAGESFVQKWGTTLIGVGIVPRFTRVKNKERKQVINDLWKDFVAQSDADGVLNLYGQQTLAVHSWIEAGEVFARERPRGLDAPLAVPVQVQLIEAEYCPLLDADQWNGMPPGNKMRSGIELSKAGRRVAYWFYKEHPGDGLNTTIDPSKLVRVPADQVRHIFFPSRPGALRGVSPLTSILTNLRNVSDYEDAVLERQKLANLFMAFIKWSLPNMAGADTDPLTGLPFGGDAASPLAGMAPGTMQELEPGQEVIFANPPEAGTTYSDYIRTRHLGTASGGGMPYEVFSGDIANVSDRTLRVIMNEFRRFAEQRQWQVVIPMFCQPVVEWFAKAGLLKGVITVEEAELVKRCEHAPHGWAHIHPVQDPQGKQIELEMGVRSRSSIIGSAGDDPDTVDQERADDKKREDELGLTPVAVEPQRSATQSRPVQDDDDDEGETGPQQRVLF